MGFNAAGTLAVFQVLARPHLVLPKLIIKDIRQLDLEKLRRRGVTGFVLDKDNCLTKPLDDELVPELKEAWPRLLNEFGRENVLLVSNSAGTRDDAGLLQAESVSRHLGVPVLLHKTKKPGCAPLALQYFASAGVSPAGSGDASSDRKGKGRARDDYPPAAVVDVPSYMRRSSTIRSAFSAVRGSGGASGVRETHGTILVVGDRVMTDVVLANRMQDILRRRYRGATGATPVVGGERRVQVVPVLTETVWKMEGLGSRVMRALEGLLLKRALAHYRRKNRLDPLHEWSDCILPPPTHTHADRVKQEMEAAQEDAQSAALSLRERLAAVWAGLLAPIRTAYTRRRDRVYGSIEEFWKEAKGYSFGYSLPRSISNVRRLGRILDNLPAGHLKKSQ